MEEIPVWAEVDLGRIAGNVRALLKMMQPGTRLMAVVKANAYGHGALPVAQTALAAGASSLGVARISEAIDLREGGVTCPILIFGYTSPDLFMRLARYDLTQTVYSVDTAEALARAAHGAGKSIRVHLKIDTGMGRLGFLHGIMPDHMPGGACAASLVSDVITIKRMKGLEVEGIFTHFASAESLDRLHARNQFEMFTDLLDALDRNGVEIPFRHAANSAALMEMPETHLDMVRAGIAIYGLSPAAHVDGERAGLMPAMSFKTRVVHTKEVPKGFQVSYGSCYAASEKTVVATVSAGYADGLNRLLSLEGQMLVHGEKVPVAGRVCMDMTMLDVGHVPGVSKGDEVVIFGNQMGSTIGADRIAELAGTISYEVICAVSSRVPRIYVQDGILFKNP